MSIRFVLILVSLFALAGLAEFLHEPTERFIPAHVRSHVKH